MVTDYAITDKTDDIYTSCTATYWDAEKEEDLTYTYDPWAKGKQTAGNKMPGNNQP